MVLSVFLESLTWLSTALREYVTCTHRSTTFAYHLKTYCLRRSRILSMRSRQKISTLRDSNATNDHPLDQIPFIACRKKKLSAETVNRTIDVYTKEKILWPLSLICCTFMPKIDEAKLMGTKMKARTVTMLESLVSILEFLLKRFGGLGTHKRWRSWHPVYWWSGNGSRVSLRAVSSGIEFFRVVPRTGRKPRWLFHDDREAEGTGRQSNSGHHKRTHQIRGSSTKI